MALEASLAARNQATERPATISADDNDIKLLAALAARLQSDPNFMAQTLAVYQRQAELDDEALAAELGTLPEIVVRLALCQRPDANSSDFAAQVNALSDFTLIDATLLRRVIEQVASAAQPTSHAAAFAARPGAVSWLHPLAGLLNAARDRVSAFARHPVPVIASVICLMVAAAIGALIWRESRKPSAPSIATHHATPTAAPDASAASTTPAAASSPAPSSGAVSPTPSEPLARAITREIDLEGYTLVRDVGGSRSSEQAIPLRPVLTNFVLTLPERSTAGWYRVSFVDADGQPLVKEKRARSRRSRGGKTLTVTLNLSGLPEKPCRLRITRGGETDDYPAVIGRAAKK